MADIRLSFGAPRYRAKRRRWKYKSIHQLARGAQYLGARDLPILVQIADNRQFARRVFDRKVFLFAFRKCGQIAADGTRRQASGRNADGAQNADCLVAAMRDEGPRGNRSTRSP